MIPRFLEPWTLCAWPSGGRSRRRPGARSAASRPPPERRAAGRGRGCGERGAGTSLGTSAETRQTPPGGGKRNTREFLSPSSHGLFQTFTHQLVSHLTPELVMGQRQQPVQVLRDEFGMFHELLRLGGITVLRRGFVRHEAALLLPGRVLMWRKEEKSGDPWSATDLPEYIFYLIF